MFHVEPRRGYNRTAAAAKEKYIYYKWGGSEGDCGEPYTREAVIAEQFTAALRSISLDAGTLQLMPGGLRSSFGDEQAFHSSAVARLEAVCATIQKRIDQISPDHAGAR